MFSVRSNIAIIYRLGGSNLTPVSPLQKPLGIRPQSPSTAWEYGLDIHGVAGVHDRAPLPVHTYKSMPRYDSCRRLDPSRRDTRRGAPIVHEYLSYNGERYFFKVLVSIVFVMLCSHPPHLSLSGPVTLSVTERKL